MICQKVVIEMYQINEISNRDIALLYNYRILRKASNFLSAVFTADTPLITEISEGSLSDLQTDSGEPIYLFDLGVELDTALIPYLEFETDNEVDQKNLESLLYLEGSILYGKVPTFQKAVRVSIYQVQSISAIESAIQEYLDELGKLDIEELKDLIEQRRAAKPETVTIAGIDNNLVKFNEGDVKDSGYTITTALDAQLLINPSQELLMTLPRTLKHNINISVTDGITRYLSSFNGYSINLIGNCDWVLRDINSGVNFVSGAGKIYLWNCRLVHFRNRIDGIESSGYQCALLHAHRSLVVINQGQILDLCEVGGSTVLEVSGLAQASQIQKVSLVGHGCSLYCTTSTPEVDTSEILGTAWFNDWNGNMLYIAGRRVDEAGGQHDAELQPSKIIEYKANNIHIYQGSE